MRLYQTKNESNKLDPYIVGETKSSNIPSISSNKKKKIETVMDMLDTKRIQSYDQLANNQNFKLQDEILKANGKNADTKESKPFLNVTVKFTDAFQLPTEPDVNPINEEQELELTLSTKSLKKKSLGVVSKKTDIEKEKLGGKKVNNTESIKKPLEDAEGNKDAVIKDFEFG